MTGFTFVGNFEYRLNLFDSDKIVGISNLLWSLFLVNSIFTGNLLILV